MKSSVYPTIIIISKMIMQQKLIYDKEANGRNVWEAL